jgi:hypothetical protein
LLQAAIASGSGSSRSAPVKLLREERVDDSVGKRARSRAFFLTAGQVNDSRREKRLRALLGDAGRNTRLRSALVAKTARGPSASLSVRAPSTSVERGVSGRELGLLQRKRFRSRRVLLFGSPSTVRRGGVAANPSRELTAARAPTKRPAREASAAGTISAGSQANQAPRSHSRSPD